MGGLEDGEIEFDFEGDRIFGYPVPASKTVTRA